MEGQLATNHPDGVEDREPVGIFVGLQRRFVHQAASGKMRRQQAIEFLPDQSGGLASQDDFRSAKVRLEFIQCALDLPPFLVERRQFLRRGFGRVEDRCHQAVDRRGLRDPLQLKMPTTN